MRYFVKENTWVKRNIYPIDHGWGNGYVLLDEGHPFYGMDYTDINYHISVHWGLTFSKKICNKFVESWDELTDADLGKWCVGFDTSHCDDTLDKWPKWAVEEEAKRLFDQLSEIETIPTS